MARVRLILGFIALAVISLGPGLGIAPAAEWEYLAMDGIQATCIEDDPVHARLFVGTIEGFHYLDLATGIWTERDWEGWIGRTVRSIGWHPDRETRVLTGRVNAFFKGYIELSDDLGATEEIVYSSEAGDVTGIARDPDDADRYYACTWHDITPGEIVRSLDGGESWLPLASVIHTAMTGIAVDAAGAIYVSGDARVTRSVDGGDQWAGAWNGLPAGYGCYCIGADPDGEGALLASNDLGLYLTEDAGDVWTEVLAQDCRAVEWGGTVVSVPGGPTYRLAAAITWDARVMLSLDGGLAWDDITGDLPSTPIDVAFAPFDNLLYVATAGDGVFRAPWLDPQAVLDDHHGRGALCLLAPTPFPVGGELRFELPRGAWTRLTLHDVAGRWQATLIDAALAPGPHAVAWRTDAVAPGCYFARLESGGARATVRLLLLD